MAIFLCPLCKANTETGVLDVRPFKGGLRRRRHCKKCELKFSTFEECGYGPKSSTEMNLLVSRIKHQALELFKLSGDLE